MFTTRHLEAWRSHAAKAYAYGVEERPGAYAVNEVDALIDRVLAECAATPHVESHELRPEEL